ncbi:hypothetical protein FHU41_001827 [Psychromicrobium silvestre]|uniref:Uncharacterized protein n=2 Tax=Psychromicrobium silvestre TaxID=1645614 RepID=A0A7Y9LU02_9MICC|nr:hypothetical protein [Psychromicrobium silvestre]
MLLYKDSIIVGTVSLVFFASMLFPKPLAFYFGQRLSAGGGKENRDWWYSLWEHPYFRTAQRKITIIWGTCFLLQAAINLLIVTVGTFTLGYIVSQLLPFAAVALAISLTLRIASQAMNDQHDMD